MKLLRNEDIVHLYLMTSLYAGEGGMVKMGIAKDCDQRAQDVGGKLEMVSLPQLRPLTLEIEKATHNKAILKGIKKAVVSRRSGSTEWFVCSVKEAQTIYKWARNRILGSGNLANAKEFNKTLKAEIRKKAKYEGIKENEEMIFSEKLETAQGELDL
jgi:hypothetical protein